MIRGVFFFCFFFCSALCQPLIACVYTSWCVSQHVPVTKHLPFTHSTVRSVFVDYKLSNFPALLHVLFAIKMIAHSNLLKIDTVFIVFVLLLAQAYLYPSKCDTLCWIIPTWYNLFDSSDETPSWHGACWHDAMMWDAEILLNKGLCGDIGLRWEGSGQGDHALNPIEVCIHQTM